MASRTTTWLPTVALLCLGLSGCDIAEPELDSEDLRDDEVVALDLLEWQTLVELFEPAIPGGSELWFIGTAAELDPANDFCSAAFAQELASDPWALDSEVTDSDLSVEDYLVDHLPSILNAARSHHAEGDEAATDASVSGLRAFLIRAALQSSSIRRVRESDRFGGYHCIEIVTPAGTFTMANGRWS